MGTKELIIIIISVVLFVVIYVMIAAAIMCDTLNQVRVEAARARSERGRKYWRKKLWITWLKIIPFGYLIVRIARLERRH